MKHTQKLYIASFVVLAIAFVIALAFVLNTSDVAYADSPVVITTAGGNPVDPEDKLIRGELPIGHVGQVYSETLVASGGSGTYKWSIVTGSLVNGLTLDPDTGVISGTPTTTQSGYMLFKAMDADDNSNYDTANLTFYVADDTWPPNIVTDSLYPGVVGEYYSEDIACAASSLDDVDWTLIAGDLPTGLTLGRTGNWNGRVYGTPTEAGTYTFTLKADNIYGTAQKEFTIVIDNPFTLSYDKTAKYYLGDSIQVNCTGINNSDVNWSIEHNTSANTTISSEGLLTIGADETSDSVTVLAISKTNPRNGDNEVVSYIAKTPYTITVINGVSKDSTDNIISEAAADESITIVAEEIPGKQFREWTVEAGSAAVTFTSATARSTSFDMVAGNVIVKANYNTIISTVSATFDWPVNGNHVDKTLVTGGEEYTAYLYGVWYRSGLRQDGYTLDDVVFETGQDVIFYVQFSVASAGYVMANRNDLTVILNGNQLDNEEDYYSGYGCWGIEIPVSAYNPIQNIQISSEGILSWDAFTGADDYEIYIDYNIGGDNENTGGKTSFDLKGEMAHLYAPSQTITYSITALDSEDNPISAEVFGTYNYVSDGTAIPTPENLVWDHTTIRWDAVPNSYGYHYVVYKTVGDVMESYGTIYGRNYQELSGLEVDTSYYFTVYAIPQLGDYDHYYSETATSTEKMWEHVAASLTNVTITDGILTFDSLGEGSYIYEISIDTGGGYVYSLPIDLYKMAYSILHDSGTYDIKIRVYNEYGEPLVPAYTYEDWVYDKDDNPYKSISGTPIITGTAKYGETLTVDTSGLTYTGDLRFTWYVKNVFGEWNSTGAANLTVNTYTVSGYIGLQLKVLVTSTGNEGYVESSPTAEILPSDDALTGTPRIEGAVEYGNTISAYLDDTNNPSEGYLNYQWRRNGVNIDGAISRDYTPIADDIGKTLSVVITSDCFQGNRTSSETAAVDKGHKNAPAGLSTTPCTTYENNNGSITNTDDTMEYRLSTASDDAWIDVTGSSINGLQPGTYYVRYKASSTLYESEKASVTIESAPTYYISISGGVAKIGNEVVTRAAVGATITIVANEPEFGSIFDEWTTSDAITFADANSSTTTFVMIDDSINISANYKGAALTGIVTINATGGFKYNQLLTLSFDTNNTGNYTYQWKRDGENIVGATIATYTLVEADIGHTISVLVGSDYQTGTIESSPTIAIAKADGPSKPSVVANRCTTYENNDGSITSTNDTMEYRLSTAGDDEWVDVTGDTIADLVPGTYYVRYKETSTHLASAYDSKVIEAAVLYDVDVVYGVAKIDGVEVNQAAKGATITVIADAPSTGYLFDYWSETWDQVAFADISDSTTTFVMVDNNVWIRANYFGAPLAGTVSLVGTGAYDSGITINMNLNGTGSFYYQWKRDGVNIDGATSSNYYVTVEDIGHFITVEVRTSVQSGSVVSDSIEAQKAPGGSAPTSPVGYGCTTPSNNDGMLAGLWDTYEYRIQSGVWADATDTTIYDLTPGTYEVRVKETATHYASATKIVVINEYNAPTLYAVSVSNGSADPTTAEEGTEVTITAHAPAFNYEFDKWVSEDVEFEDEYAATTTFEMPADNVTITATYKLVKHTVSFNANEGGTGSKAAVQVQHGDLYTLPENPFTANVGKGFVGWAYASDGDVINGTQIQINADTELFAIWEDVHIHTMQLHAAKAATCTQAGNIAYYECTSCHNLYTDELGANQIYEQDTVINALGHNYQETVTAPTCTAAGYTTHTCSRCSDSYQDTEVPALGHQEAIDAAVAPTCTETGLTAGKHCSRCNTVLVAQTEVPALGHNWGDWTVVTPAQVDVPGEERRVCSRNNTHIETRAIPALPYPHTDDTYEATVIAGTAKDVANLFAQAKAANGKVEVTVGTMKITFNEGAVNAIGGNAASLTANVLTENLDIAGAQLVVEVTLTGATFANGKATIVVPFTTAVPEGKVAKVYYVNGNERVDMNATFADGKASFETNHFSKFAIVFDDIPSPQPENPDQPAKKGLSGGAIAGIVIAIIVALGAAGFCVYWFVFRKKKGDAPKVEEKKEDESQEEAKEEPQEEKVEEEQPEETPEENKEE